MARTLGYAAALALTAGLSLATAGTAAAAPACSDPVANSIDSAHEITGDPGGLIHTTETIYCNAKP